MKFTRLERQLRLIERFNNKRKELGITGTIKPIPLKLALPLLEGATLEDDGALQDRWAALLVKTTNPESGVELNRRHIDILERLSPFEALILDTLYSLPYEEMHSGGAVTADLPDSTCIFEVDGKTVERPEPSEEIKAALANLAMLNCIVLPTTWSGGEVYSSVIPTLIGKNFVDACRLEKNVN